MSTELQSRIALKSDTAANWASSSIVLLKGEIGFEVDTNKFKFGDGISTWSTLPYCGTTILTDNKSIELLSNGNLQILNFDEVTTAGKQLRSISDGASSYKLEWFTPDISSISGLSTKLTSIETDVTNLDTAKADKSSLSAVATSGSYNDLSNKPSAYVLPTASNTVLGGVKIDNSTIKITSGVISVQNNSHNHTIENINNLSSTLATYVPLSQKGAANGVATLDASSKIPTSQLPSYVSDVFEFANLAGFPSAGEANKIYVAKDTNKTYRWSGTQYTEISASISLGTTSGTAYEGSAGAALASSVSTLQTNYNNLGTLAHKSSIGNSDITSVNVNKIVQAASSADDLLIINCGSSSTIITSTTA